MSVKRFFPKSLDQIHIEQLEVSCRVGATEKERAFPQDLSLSLTLSLALQKAGRSDRLRDTVNYAKIIEEVRNLLQGKTFWLIETVAEQTAHLTLDRFKVEEVSVAVSKRTVPGVKLVTVFVTRSKHMKTHASR